MYIGKKFLRVKRINSKLLAELQRRGFTVLIVGGQGK